jgi:hypothetical protein
VVHGAVAQLVVGVGGDAVVLGRMFYDRLFAADPSLKVRRPDPPTDARPCSACLLLWQRRRWHHVFVGFRASLTSSVASKTACGRPLCMP